MRRWMIRAGLVAGVLILAWAALAGVRARQVRGELEQARAEIARGQIENARRRLADLDVAWPGSLGDEADYWLGVCHWNTGRRAEALEAFGRIPPGSEYEPLAAAFLARDLLMRWRFRDSEDRLKNVLRPGRPTPWPVHECLIRLGRMEARFEEVRNWLRGAVARSDDPIPLLRQLWLVDRGATPIAGVRENLQQAIAQSPDDDRIWLGLGRVATLEGRLNEAARWLERCRARHPDDRAVALARLDLARAAGWVDEVEAILAGQLRDDLDPAVRLAWRAWIAQRRGAADDERHILELWLEAEPANPVALERLGTLAAEAGEAERAADLRRQKAHVDEALERYRRRLLGPESVPTAAHRLAMARLAEEAGRAFDARVWCTLAARLDPRAADLGQLLARLDRRAQLLRAASVEADGLRRSAPSTRGGQSPTALAQLEFRDDAVSAGFLFTFDNGATPIRQLPETMSGGIGLLDFDGDGWLDLYVTQGGPFPPTDPDALSGDRLYRNRGDGTVEDVTQAAGLADLPRGYGHGVVVGDIDNDGDPDLFLTRWRSYALYLNRGDGTFADVTEAWGLGGDRGWPTSAAFADLDGDGDVDLYVAHYLRWDAANPKICRDPESDGYTSCSPLQFDALPDHVFRNDGGRFVDVTSEAGIADVDGRGLGVVAADLDGDGRIDLFVANDQSANFLFRNLGGFRFEESGHVAGLASNAAGGYQASMGVACGDLDGDGRPDLAVTNFFGESTTLYRNLGQDFFGDQTAATGLALASRHLLGFGAAFLDANADGWLDLITANGHLDPLPGMPHAMPVQVLLGDGSRLREPASTAGSALDVPRIGRALAIGDIDNDGRIDALVLDHKGPLAYLHNQTYCGHFLVLRLEGTRSNRDAIGARVMVEAGGLRRFGWRFGGGSYQAASDARLHFGLGEANRVDAIEITWPSGLVERVHDLKPDRGYLLREGEARPLPLRGFPDDP